MGLSTEQVSIDHGLDWGQSLLMQSTNSLEEMPKSPPVHRQQQQGEPLECPRCASINTKFCYFNNYNKSQPRHFCKACKRHWTKGGTLRNVPVGGGRKNKRLKKSNTATVTTSATATSSRANTQMGTQNSHSLDPLPLSDQKNSVSEILCQALLTPPPSSTQLDSIDNIGSFSFTSLMNGNRFLGSTSTFHQNQSPLFSFSSLSSFENNPSSLSNSFDQSSSDTYNYAEGLGSVEDSNMASILPTAATISTVFRPGQVSSTSKFMDMPDCWNLEDIDALVSYHELNIPWDETEGKP